MTVLIALHVLAATIWVGGMFFAYVALRPVAAGILEPPKRLELWSKVFNRFFVWVWTAVVLLPVTGFWMVFAYLGGYEHVGTHVSLMTWAGIAMILLFMHVFFAPYRKLKQALAQEQIQQAANNLNQIRQIIAVNLTLGIVVVLIASAGKYW